jgi:outer membrane protein
VRAEASLDAAAAAEERALRLLTDTQALLDAGMAVKADVLAAQARVASAHVAVVRAQTRRLSARSRLRSLLHVQADDAIELADRLALTLPDPPAPLADLQASALAGRPELAAAAAQLGALAERERLAAAPARPEVALEAAWEYSRPNIRYFPLEDEWNDSWSVGVVAGWTLFDGGRSRADTRTAEAERRAAASQRDELARSIALEVEVSRQELASALATVDAADAARSAADERERASRERLAAGMAPMVEVLDAQSELAAAEQQQIDTRATAWIAAAYLGRAVGK